MDSMLTGLATAAKGGLLVRVAGQGDTPRPTPSGAGADAVPATKKVSRGVP